MTENIKTLSTREANFLSQLATDGKTIFSLHEAQLVWDNPARTAVALSRLAEKGWLRRLERGLYMLIPLEAGPDRAWFESSLAIASHLIDPAAIAYWTALHYWGWTEQIPQVTLVQSTRRKLPVEIMGMQFRFVTLTKAHFFGIQQRSSEGKIVSVTDREKTLLDAAARPDLSGGILQLAQALRAAQAQIDWPKLDIYLARWGGGAVLKRLGYLAEVLNLAIPERDQRLEKWQRLLTAGISQLEPGAGRHGSVITRWKVRINVEVI
jgi:predicted transcriptional regulator of viral defense system